MKRFSFLFNTDRHLTGLILRLTLSLVMLPHGCQLLLGWFGGYGFSASMNYLTETEGLPPVIGFLVILLQFFGSLFILSGFATRPVALAMVIMFIGMIATSHWSHGMFMNWSGQQSGEGIEFHLLAIGLSAALVSGGSGAYSIDALISGSSKRVSFQTPPIKYTS